MKVKICCISSVEEARLAIRAGATELGLVGPMPSGPGMISEETIKEIVDSVPKSINTFLLTSETSADKIIAQHAKVNTSTIQIVDKMQHGSYEDIRKAIPNIQLVQVIHVENEESIRQVKEVESEVDFILLDSGSPGKAIKELGGTGRTHNWDISKTIVKSTKTPVFLAGGLKAENVRQARDHVNPYGLDLCSGIRTNNQLNQEKLFSFFDQLKK